MALDAVVNDEEDNTTTTNNTISSSSSTSTTSIKTQKYKDNQDGKPKKGRPHTVKKETKDDTTITIEENDDIDN